MFVEVSMRILARCIAAAVLAVLSMPQVFAQSSRPLVAVLDFDYGSIQKWWSGTQDVGSGVSDLLVDALLEDGSFRIIERKRLDAILAEQNFSNSQRADPSAKTLAEIGKVLGVKYLIVGSITKFGTESSSKSVGGGIFGSRVGLGSVGKAEGKANVALTARVLDVSTAEILVSTKGEGTSKRSGLLLSGGGSGVSRAATGALDFQASDFKDTILGEATETAVTGVVKGLVAKKDRLQ
jgi:curli biogenesis system outer membrane secretion channel CsgG